MGLIHDQICVRVKENLNTNCRNDIETLQHRDLLLIKFMFYALYYRKNSGLKPCQVILNHSHVLWSQRKIEFMA